MSVTLAAVTFLTGSGAELTTRAKGDVTVGTETLSSGVATKPAVNSKGFGKRIGYLGRQSVHVVAFSPVTLEVFDFRKRSVDGRGLGLQRQKMLSGFFVDQTRHESCVQVIGVGVILAGTPQHTKCMGVLGRRFGCQLSAVRELADCEDGRKRLIEEFLDACSRKVVSSALCERERIKTRDGCMPE